MITTMKKPKTLLLALVAGGCIAVLQTATAQAYSFEQQQACTPDAFRFCGRYIPDIQSITACMVANKALLSPQCRATFPSDYSARKHIRHHRIRT